MFPFLDRENADPLGGMTAAKIGPLLHRPPRLHQSKSYWGSQLPAYAYSRTHTNTQKLKSSEDIRTRNKEVITMNCHDSIFQYSFILLSPHTS
jgi:hypothetical protein